MPDDGYDSIHDAFLAENPSMTLEGTEYVGHPDLYEALQGNKVLAIPSVDMAAMVTSVYAGEITYLPQGIPAVEATGEDGGSPAQPVFTTSGDPATVASVSLTLKNDPLPAAFVPNTLYKLNCGKLGKSVSDLTAGLYPEGDTDFASIGGSLLDRLFGDLFAAHAAEGVTFSGKTITFTSGLTGVAIVTDCDLKFNGGTYEDSMFITTSDSNQALQIVNSSPTIIGRNDDCAPGGEVTFVVPNGRVHGSAKTSFYDANIYGGGDLDLSAQAGDVGAGEAVGLDIQVAGNAQIEALASFTGCGGTNAYGYEPWKYRLVQ
jgi:hypothetical protein